MQLDQLRELMPPPRQPIDPGSRRSWDEVEATMGIRLPPDYKAFVDAYGTGSIDEFVTVLNPHSSIPHFRLIDYGETMLDVTRDLRNGGIVEIPFSIYPEPGGILPWGVTTNGDWCYWLTEPQDEPDRWGVVVGVDRGPEWLRHRGPMTRFLIEILDGTTRVPFFPGDFPSTSPVFVPVSEPA